MRSMGTNDRQRTEGDCSPTAAATKPKVAARLYPGAVEATPITTLERKPSAPPLSPLPPISVSRSSAPGALFSPISSILSALSPRRFLGLNQPVLWFGPAVNLLQGLREDGGGLPAPPWSSGR